ncbi:hypothetical protein ACQJBY_029131 [Aegilops geniculata]
MWSGAAAAAARTVSPPLYTRSLTGRRGAGRPSTVSVRAGGGGGLMDFVGGDLVKPDLGRWLADVEEHKALAIYPPHEGGYEGRYLNRLRYQGYYFLDLSARGLGDPESTLTKIHPVCPVHPQNPSLASGGSRWRGGTSRRRWTTGSACCTRTPKGSSSGSTRLRFCPRLSCSSWPCSLTSAPKSGSSRNAATGENSSGNR